MTQSPNTPILPDFVFGGIESDESRLLVNERARWQSIRHEQLIKLAAHPIHPARQSQRSQ